MIKTEIIKSSHPVALRHAVDILRHGGVVAFPTDTVYGLAVTPYTAETVERLFTVKGRNSSRAIAILIGQLDQLSKVTTNISEIAQRLVKHFWPGPLTLVVPKHESLPDVISPNQTVGVRMPDHPFALRLLNEIGPLAVSSANLSGADNTTTASEVMSQLKGRVDLILDGGVTPGGIPSTVVDCTGINLSILRPGPLTLDELENALR